MQCPKCLRSDKFKKGIRVITDDVINPGKTYDVSLNNPLTKLTFALRKNKIGVGLEYKKYSQLYMDICTYCGTVVRTYIKTKNGGEKKK